MLASVLDPLYQLMGAILAAIYGVVPNYAVAIFGLTMIVLAILTPLTLKGLRSTIKIQKLLPEQKKLQAEFKDDRQALNEALMALYKENKVSPASGCLPFLVQSPFFIALFGVLQGMSRVHRYPAAVAGKPFAEWGDPIKLGRGAKAPADALVVGAPKHLPEGSELYKSLFGTREVVEGSGLPTLRHAPGEIKAFGFDLARSASEMASKGFFRFLPYLSLLVAMVGLQVLAQRQVNRRNPAAAAANPQMQVITKFMPFLFGIWGWAFQAGLTLYWTTSAALRIVQQWALYRFDPTLSESVKEKKQELEAQVKGGKGGAGKGAAPGKGAVAGKGAAAATTGPRSGAPGAKGKGAGGAAKGSNVPALTASKAVADGPKPAGARPVGRQQPKKRRKGR